MTAWELQQALKKMTDGEIGLRYMEDTKEFRVQILKKNHRIASSRAKELKLAIELAFDKVREHNNTPPVPEKYEAATGYTVQTSPTVSVSLPVTWVPGVSTSPPPVSPVGCPHCQATTLATFSSNAFNVVTLYCGCGMTWTASLYDKFQVTTASGFTYEYEASSGGWKRIP